MIYECHITIDPVFNERLEQFKNICKDYNFKVAKLLMANDRLSDKDSFCTGHSKSLIEIQNKMLNLLAALKENNYAIRRYKIEQILLDSRYNDEIYKL